MATRPERPGALPHVEPSRRGPRVLVPLPKADAHEPGRVTYAIALAMRALHEGKANEGQQKAVFEWLIAEACAKRHFPYHPSDRDTVFALGRVFVADQVLGLLSADLSMLKEG